MSRSKSVSFRDEAGVWWHYARGGWVRTVPKLVVIVLALVLASCAHPAVSPCPEPCSGDGLRFYRPTMYALVASDGTWKTMPLPDYSQQYVLHVEGWLGDASLNPTLTDGWNFSSMASGTSNDATLAAVAGAAVSAKGLMMGGALLPSGRTSLAPGLYRLDLEHRRLVGPLPVVSPP